MLQVIIVELSRKSLSKPWGFGFKRPGHYGMCISRVDRNSSADRVGLLVGDKILAINGDVIVDGTTLKELADIFAILIECRLTIERGAVSDMAPTPKSGPSKNEQ